MLKKYSKEPTEQVEAKAVSNLLEIDRIQDDPNWEEKRGNPQNSNKNRTFSVFRISQPVEQHHTAKNCLKHRNFLYSHEQSSHINVSQSPRNIEQQSSKEKQSKVAQNHWVDGQFWSSKVNWMADSAMREHSQLPLHRRRPNAFENHGKAARERANRYDNPEKTLSKQLKNNLAFNLSRQKLSRSREEMPLTSRTTNHPSHDQLSKTNKQSKLRGSIQEYVRQAFQRIYQRNHQEQASPHKQSEQEKSTIVRKLLHNLESIRDQAPIKINDRIGRDTYRQRISNHKMKEVNLFKGNMQLQLLIDRPVLKKEQSSILNLNEQAQKVYQNRSINQFNRKNSTLIKPQ